MISYIIGWVNAIWLCWWFTKGLFLSDIWVRWCYNFNSLSIIYSSFSSCCRFFCRCIFLGGMIACIRAWHLIPKIKLTSLSWGMGLVEPRKKWRSIIKPWFPTTWYFQYGARTYCLVHFFILNLRFTETYLVVCTHFKVRVDGIPCVVPVSIW